MSAVSGDAFSRRAAANPSIPGIDKSSTITSGWCAFASAMARVPVDTVMAELYAGVETSPVVSEYA